MRALAISSLLISGITSRLQPLQPGKFLLLLMAAPDNTHSTFMKGFRAEFFFIILL